MTYDVIIIGAGAAGLFCAAMAGQRGRKVLLIDHAEIIGEKIRISGGGRCNFTNINTGPSNYLSQNLHFCRSALSRYTPQDFINLLHKHGIAYHEKTLGQLFCDDSAQNIIDILLRECTDGKVDIKHPVTLTQFAYDAETKRFTVHTATDTFSAAKLVIATGGLSIPAIGATALGYEIAKQFNVPLTPLRAGLVPLALDAPELARYGNLSGTSFSTVASTCSENPTFREAALLTHKGLSGPAVLQISSYWKPGEAVYFDLLPDINANEWLTDLRTKRISFAAALADFIPGRLAEAWALAHAPDQGKKSPSQWTKLEQETVAKLIKAWPLKPSGTLGYKKAEVTLGGVDTKALNQQNMSVRAMPSLHFIGEVVDVTGWLGGYNFQWAWSSAYVCAEGL